MKHINNESTVEFHELKDYGVQRTRYETDRIKEGAREARKARKAGIACSYRYKQNTPAGHMPICFHFLLLRV
jgi:hypothetical protein